MSVQIHIDRLVSAKTKLKKWLMDNGYTVSSTDKIDDICNQIYGIKLQRFDYGEFEPNDSNGKENDLYFIVGK